MAPGRSEVKKQKSSYFGNVNCNSPTSAFLAAQAVANVPSADACYPNYFIPARMAGGNGNGRARNVQKICEELDAGLVGAAFDGWSGERKLKIAFLLARG